MVHVWHRRLLLLLVLLLLLLGKGGDGSWVWRLSTHELRWCLLLLLMLLLLLLLTRLHGGSRHWCPHDWSNGGLCVLPLCMLLLLLLLLLLQLCLFGVSMRCCTASLS